MNFEEYNKLSASKKRQYIEFIDTEKNISESVKNSEETRQLAKPLYKKSSFWIMLISALIPTFLGALAFYGTNAREFFNNKVTEVKLEKRELKLQIDSLNKIKKGIEAEVLDVQNYYKEEFKKKEVREEKMKASFEEEKSKLIVEQNKLNDKLNIKNRSLEDYKKDLTEALKGLKKKNEEIFELNRILKIPEITSVRDMSKTMVMKNIFIYMLYNKKRSVTIDELRREVDKSITVNFVMLIVGEYDSDFRNIGFSTDENSEKTILTFKNATLDYLLDFNFVD